MKYTTLLLAAATVAYAVDGETGPDNSTTPTDTLGEITIHKVIVGKVENTFQPNSIQAKAGDIVEFTFYPGNHSVIRAAYGYPCVPYEDVVTNGQGFNSGPMAANDTNHPTYNLTINNTDPTFFYCGAPASCFGWGMLGVINANNDTDLVKQIAIARQEVYETWPGQQIPAPALASLAAIAATATLVSSATSSASSATTTSAAAATETSSHSISAGAIAGIAVGAAAVALLAAALFFFIGRSHRSKKEQQQHLLSQNHPPAPMRQTWPDSSYPAAGYNQGQLPPYMAEAKHPYDHGVQYAGQDGMHSPPLPFMEHPSYMDRRSMAGSPPPQLSHRYSTTSELDGAMLSTAHSTPHLGTVQELDTTERMPR